MKNNNGGFTLVELIVVAVLVSALVGAGTATFLMFTKETSVAAANMKAQIQGEALYTAMAKAAREANIIMPVNDTTAQAMFTYSNKSLNALRCSTVYFCKFRESDASKAEPPFAGFRVMRSTGVVQMWVPTTGFSGSAGAGSFSDFILGGETVKVIPDSLKFPYSSTGAEAALSSSNRMPFQLNPGTLIKSFETDLTLRVVNHRDTVNLKLGRGKFSCRI
jgi:prepilin-type N-terminal cleavage/methylation domain-containing protein